MMRQDNQLLVITHLSQLATLLTGFGGLIIPLILWATQKDRVEAMDTHGKAIINFQLSIIVYYILSIPLILFFGLGLFVLFVVGTLGLILPIVNAVKVSNHQQPVYFMNITFIK